MDINTKIEQYLKQLEQEKDIKILLACETGSRAWGFPSPDSDFDIRLIYVHRKKWYLSLSEGKDNINRMFENNDIDITGWELRKSLRLLKKSNAALLERIQSPILYRCEPDFLAEIKILAQNNYSRIATVHHYLSMARSFYDEIAKQDAFKLKKFFYTLRSAMVCKWIVEKEEMPPIEFQKVLNGLTLDENLRFRINELITLKATINEDYLHTGEKDLLDFIKSCIDSTIEKRLNLPASKGNIDELNTFFRKTIS
ncbi:MAG: nucleotidyltransferase domain-containing protein [Chitinophagales bacterium]